MTTPKTKEKKKKNRMIFGPESGPARVLLLLARQTNAAGLHAAPNALQRGH